MAKHICWCVAARRMRLVSNIEQKRGYYYRKLEPNTAGKEGKLGIYLVVDSVEGVIKE